MSSVSVTWQCNPFDGGCRSDALGVMGTRHGGGVI